MCVRFLKKMVSMMQSWRRVQVILQTLLKHYNNSYYFESFLLEQFNLFPLNPCVRLVRFGVSYLVSCNKFIYLFIYY